MADVDLRALLDGELDGGARVAQLEAWINFREDFDVQLRHATAEEQRRHLLKKGKRKKEPSAKEQSAFWLAHVLSWRGLEDGEGKEIEFTEQRLQRLWDLDSEFAAWIVEESQKLDNFLGAPSAEEAAGGVADTD